MEDAVALHADIRRLRKLAFGTDDAKALAAIHELIQELKRRAGDPENGRDGEDVV